MGIKIFNIGRYLDKVIDELFYYYRIDQLFEIVKIETSKFKNMCDFTNYTFIFFIYTMPILSLLYIK